VKLGQPTGQAVPGTRGSPWAQGRPARVVEFGLFFLSSSAFQASRLAVNLIAASVLAPDAFGVWSLALVAMTYATYGNLGILSGANREIPLRLGAGSAQAADDIERAAFGWSTLAGVAMAVAATVAGVVVGGERPFLGLVLGIALLLQQVYLFYQVSLRARLAFNAASTQQALLAIAFPAIAIPLLLVAQVVGLITAQALAYGLGAVLAASLWRRALRPSLDRALARELIGIGFPIMLSGLAFAAATTVDRWVVLAVSGQYALGQYALASTVSSSLMFVTLVVAQQFYPRLAVQFGRAGASRSLRRMALSQSLTATAVIAPVAVGLIVLGPLILPTLFPAYVESVGALQVLSLGYLILGMASGFTNLLITVGLAWTLLVLQVATAIIGATLSVLALSAGLGLTGVALGTSVSFAGLLAGAAILAWRATDG
jgi:lipopolysaccharide exporter